jgi:hypothetical protein
MNTTHRLITLMTGLSLFASQELFANEAKGLLEGNCMKCHTTEVYNRDNRKVKNLMGLHTQVEACNTQIGTGWFPEDTSAVVDYLNQQHYKFKTK